MKTWLSNLHWTKRLLFSFIGLTYPWVDIATSQYEEPAGDIALMIIITVLCLYWIAKPFIERSSAGA